MSLPTQLKLVKGCGYKVQVVDHLELLLERAKAGEVLELVMGYKLKDGDLEYSFTGCDNLLELVGYLERLKSITILRMDHL